MTIFQAKEYDPRVEKRRRMYVIGGIIVIAIAAFLIYHYRNWREERTVNRFFAAVEQKDYDKAYGIWNADPNWKQHPQKYSMYTLGQFTLDWGPSSEYGTITSHRVDCALAPPKKDFASPTGVVVVVTINNRAEPRSMWVEKKSKVITDSPVKVACHGQQ